MKLRTNIHRLSIGINCWKGFQGQRSNAVTTDTFAIFYLSSIRTQGTREEIREETTQQKSKVARTHA